MPITPRVDEAERLAVFNDIGNDENFWTIFEQEFLLNMDFKRTECAAEGDMLGGSQRLLIAEDSTP